MTAPFSFLVEVDTGELNWSTNSVRLPSLKAAEAYGLDLSFRWTAVRRHRVVASQDPVNADWDAAQGLTLRELK